MFFIQLYTLYYAGNFLTSQIQFSTSSAKSPELLKTVAVKKFSYLVAAH